VRICLECRSPLTDPGWHCTSCGYAPKALDGLLAFAPALSPAHGGFEPAHFELLARREDRHFWFVARRRLICGLLERYFPNAERFFEIGCGTGSMLAELVRRLPALRLSGGDIHAKALALAVRRTGRAALIYQLDACRTPFRSEFDVVGAFDVLEHVEDDAAALTEMFATLRPNGGLILSVPQHPWLWSDVDRTAHHRRRYRLGELEAKLRCAGFSIVRTTSFVTSLLPAMMLSRWAKRGRTGETAELDVGDLLNRAATGLLLAEAKAIRLGISLPIGGTRFVVARRRG
jgi:SAM-dependent methyltransferase